MNVDEIHQQLAMEYLSVMKNREQPQAAACIIFSGVPGSGKTTLARKLARDLKAQYILTMISGSWRRPMITILKS